MPSGLSLQKSHPGVGVVVLVDGAGVVLGLRVVVEAGAAEVTTGLDDVLVTDAVVETPGFFVVVDGNGGSSVRVERNKENIILKGHILLHSTNLVPQNLRINLPVITSLLLSYP